jgi:hypothetical protein
LQIAAWALLTPVPVALWAFSQPRKERPYALGLAVLVAAAWLTFGVANQSPAPAQSHAATATDIPKSVGSSTTTSTSASASSTTSTPATTVSPTTVRTAAAGTAPAAPAPTTTVISAPQSGSLIDQLIVALEGPTTGYARDLFPTWIDADHDGCDTREEVLIRQSTVPVTTGAGCAVTTGSGSWVSIYDGVVTSDPRTFDVDHLVPLAEAWRSGAATWTADRRRNFANDLDNPQLIAVTASTNRSKGDSDPASWKPPNHGSWCFYATSWVTVKVVWHLTADPAEVGALREMLVAC